MRRNIVTIYMLLENEFGVLSRITGLFRQQGYNIKSLAVEVTENPEVSQMLISVECQPATLPRVLSLLNKLLCVKKSAQALEGFDLSCHLKNVFSKLNETQKGGL